ncbi:MAG: MGH1-like glycoside hydrolase domain-containing protein [Gemmatimonadaceae bacterium]
MEPIELLARDDRWQLSAGDGLIFAPPHPLWLDDPGFWDGASVVGSVVAPLFTVALLDDDGAEVPAHLTSRRWTPSELAVEYRVGAGVTATEVRTVQPGGVLASEWRLEASRPTRLHLVAWTAQPGDALVGGVRFDGTVVFQRRAQRGDTFDIALACVGGATSWSLARSEPAPLHPRWRYTPFAPQWTRDGLAPGDSEIEPAPIVYAAVHRALYVAAEGASTAFAMRVASKETASRAAASPAPATTGHAATLGGASRRRWREYFAAVPAFRCSDPYMEHCYWYRWSCLELLATGGGVCEGTGMLHRLTSDASAGHVRELRWMRDPERARAVLRAVFARARDDGSLPVVFGDRGEATGSAISDWGGAVLALDALHSDGAFVAESYDALARYARWILDTRTAASGLPEAARAEVAFDDRERWQARERLCAVDAAVAAYGLFVALGRLALRARRPQDAPGWDEAAARLASAVRERMWDADRKLFRDVDPGTNKRVGARSAVSFYPYRTDLADARHLAGLEESLLDPQEFWTSFPVATAPADEEKFSRFGARSGVRGAEPFRGPVVPHVNSQLIDALARASRAYAPHLRPHVAHLVMRTVRMFFDGADPVRIGSHELYDPLEGRASVHRDTSDVTHSWIIDAIVQYVAGVRPHESGLTIDPMPMGLELAELSGVRVRGHPVDVRIEGERVTATIDGVGREGRLGAPMEIAM